MQYLNRKKVYKKHEPAKDAKKIYIFCEGSVREVAYFNYFKGLSTNIDIYPIPSINGKSDPAKLKENAKLLFLGDSANSIKPKHKLIKEYGDEIWFVIDTDDWALQGKIAELRIFCDEVNKTAICWFVAQSNPCFEIWLLYHLTDCKPKHKDVLKQSSFKEFVNSQISGGIDVRKVPLLLTAAIQNSKHNYIQDGECPGLYSTELHHLGEIISSFVLEQLIIVQKMNTGQVIAP